MTDRTRGTARIAVLVSGTGSNLRALVAASRAGSLGGEVVLVAADRPCRGLEWAAEEGIPTVLVEPDGTSSRASWDRRVLDVIAAAAPDLVVLAGWMRLLGPEPVAAFRGRILNVHPSLLPAFPGAHPIRDAVVAGVRVTGVTVHLVDETLDGGPILAQEAVPILPGDDEDRVRARIQRVEHRLLPWVVRALLAGAMGADTAGRPHLDPARVASLAPRPRALLSVSDKTGLEVFARGLHDLGTELVSTGGTAAALRDAGLPVTDVSAVTGFPEALDGRVKTLHPRVHAGVLADLGRPEHREALAAHAIEPFTFVVVNLYPFEAAARAGAAVPELIEEIDIGGPTLVRAAAKNHAHVAVVTDPADYGRVLAELRATGRVSAASRGALALDAFRRTAAYDAAISEELGRRLADRGGGAAARAQEGEAMLPERLGLRLVRTLPLRYGENPHQRAALYRDADGDDDGPFARAPELLQGKELSYNNILDASAAAAVCRDLRGAAAVVVKHTNPCGAAEARDLVTAWERARAGDPVSAFGGVVAVRGAVDVPLAEALTGLFLEVLVAPEVDPAALAVLARRPDLRVVVDRSMDVGPRSTVELRSAGGGVLATSADVEPDDPATWRLVSDTGPDDRARRDLDLAWRVARHVRSNAIVLVRDGAVVGVGAGQMSRVDSARLAVAKAGQRATGAVCASDAFFPFPDAVEVCLEAGVTAFVQPGGSRRDAEVIDAVDGAGAVMLLTGVRHFRH